MDSFFDLGVWLVDAILSFAYLLTGDEAAPGWVSFGLIILLAILYVWHGHSMWRFRRAVVHARQILNVKNDREITGEKLISIDRRFEHLRENTGPRNRLATAWREFRETTITPETAPESLANTERPSAYFNREELGVDAGIWRYVPAFFVSVGLLLTFLGLVAALDQTGHILDAAPAGGDTTTEGLKALLNIAGAKFIMSLTGLFCSIVFTLTLRYSAKRTDRALHRLCADIEDGCVFLSEQKIMRQMLEQAKEQTSHLQSFSTELVAQIAQPLKEDLPQAIRESIQEAIAPTMEKMSETLTDNVSDRLATGIQDAVQAMGVSIDKIRQSLEEVTSKLDQSTTTIGTLTQSVQQSATKAAEASGREILFSGRQAADAMRHNLLDPVNHLAERVEGLAAQVEAATEKLEKYAGAVDGSTEAVRSANEELGRSAEALVEAADPVRSAVVGIESASRTMGDRVEAASEAMRSTTTQTEVVMRGAKEAIEASQNTVQEGLDSFDSAVGQFKDIIERYKEIDRNLGDAFEEIERTVQVSVAEIGTFQRTVNEEFGKALNRLQAVIAQAEPFTLREDD